MAPHHWSKVPEENQTSDPNGYVQKNWPAKAMGPAVRGLMATAARARDDSLGTLVAQLGANNVYSVATNEVLIDPDTQVGGLTPAITKPFLLRLAFDTALAGSATNVPHLKADGFDCGPILNAAGGALADGDLRVTRPVLVLGDMAAAGDTKVTRVRVLDPVPSDAAVASGGPVFGCRLICTSSTALVLLPDESNQFFVNGKNITIPAGGITLTNAGYSGASDLYVYLDQGGFLVFDTAPVRSSTYGHLVDPTTGTRSLVGYTRGGFSTAGQFSVAGTWSQYNRRDRVIMGPLFGASLSTAYAWLAGSYTPFVCPPDEHADISWYGWEAQATQGTGIYNFSRLGLDGASVLTGENKSGGAAFQNSGDGARWGGSLTAGPHTAMINACSNIAGSTLTGQIVVKTRG